MSGVVDVRQHLILVEQAEQVSEAIRLKRRNPSAVQLVALSPGVMDALSRRGVAYRIPEECVQPGRLNRRGLENYANLERLGAWFEGVLGELPQPLRLNPVVIHFYHLKLMIDSVSLRVEELCAVFRALQPAHSIVLTSPGQTIWTPPSGLGFITKDGPIYAHLAPLVARTMGLSVEVRRLFPLAPLAGRCGVTAPLDRWHAWVLALREAWRWLRSWWGRVDHAQRAPDSSGGAGCRPPWGVGVGAPGLPVPRLRSGRALSGVEGPGGLHGRPTIWVVGDAVHDVPDLARTLAQRFMVVWWDQGWVRLVRSWLPALLTKRQPRQHGSVLEAFWLRHRAALAGQPVFLAAGINYFSFVEGPLRRLILTGQQEMSRLHQLARWLIQRWRPCAALGVSSADWAQTVMTLALRAEGIPVVYTQEGGLYGYCHWDMYHYRELALCDDFLAYGPGASAYLNQTRLTQRQQARALPVGGLRLRRLQNAQGPIRRRVQRVMYVPTVPFHHCLRYAPLHYSDREYHQIKQQILDALLAVPDIQVIYKPPVRTLQHDSLRPLLRQHHRRIVVCERPLTEVLDEADAFVVDWPTTSLLEVLTTQKPVAVLMDRAVTRPLEVALGLLRRRARVSVDLPSFLQDLRRGFSEPAGIGQRLDDTAFLEAYGTGGEAAWSQERLLAFFEGLAQDRRNDLRLMEEGRLVEQSAEAPCGAGGAV